MALMIRQFTQPDLKQRIAAALEIAARYSQIEGGHHKTWVIDQMVRALTKDEYTHWIKSVTEIHPGGTLMFEWDMGIIP